VEGKIHIFSSDRAMMCEIVVVVRLAWVAVVVSSSFWTRCLLIRLFPSLTPLSFFFLTFLFATHSIAALVLNLPYFFYFFYFPPTLSS
jgi:hypothetical protein